MKKLPKKFAKASAKPVFPAKKKAKKVAPASTMDAGLFASPPSGLMGKKPAGKPFFKKKGGY